MKPGQNKFAIAVLIILLSGLNGYCHAAIRQPSGRIIPKSVLFGYPDKSNPQISPDGTRLAYLAPVGGIMNVCIKTIGKPDDKPLTHVDGQGIWMFSWTADSKKILYSQDDDGDENYQIYGVDLESGITVNYTPYSNTAAELIGSSPQNPSKLVIALNKENPMFHDLFLLDLNTRDMELLMKNPGDILSYILKSNLSLGGYLQMTPEGTTDCYLDFPERGMQKAFTLSTEDFMLSRPIGFDSTGEFLFIADSRNVNTVRLTALNLKTNELQVIAGDPDYDISEVLQDPQTKKILAVEIQKERQHWIIVDPAIEPDFTALRKLNEGDFRISCQDLAGRFWVVEFYSDVSPEIYYLYDRQAKTAEMLFRSRPELENYPLARMEPFTIQSRDGLTLNGYMTYPDVEARLQLPMVLKVHGGPHTRDIWHFDSEAQFFANRGFACMQVNYRGSSGYGKSFVAASSKEWGGRMQDDLIDAVNWAIDQGIADSRKIAIYGGSYGGYAALCGATFSPDLFCCAVSYLGPSNLVSFLQSVPSYWTNLKEFFNKTVGNPDTETEFLKSRSPLFKVDQIKIPVLIAQGENDPRVKVAEAEQFIQAMRKKSIRYRFLLFPDEGHRFVRMKNRIRFYSAVERFLGVNLGGFIEPLPPEENPQE